MVSVCIHTKALFYAIASRPAFCGIWVVKAALQTVTGNTLMILMTELLSLCSLRSKGVILNISSASGMYPVPLLTVYSATKVSAHLCFPQPYLYACLFGHAICVVSLIYSLTAMFSISVWLGLCGLFLTWYSRGIQGQGDHCPGKFVKKFSLQIVFHMTTSVVFASPLSFCLFPQSVLPFFVATKMTKIRKPTLDKPTPDRYVAAEVNTVGLEDQTNGYFPHAVMVHSLIQVLNLDKIFLLHHTSHYIKIDN